MAGCCEYDNEYSCSIKGRDGKEVYIQTFIASALERSEWPVSFVGQFTPGQFSSFSHRIENLESTKIGLDSAENRKLKLSHRHHAIKTYGKREI
jgi:hypothetical protein